MNVLGKTRFSDMCLAGLYGFHQGIMNEHILVLSLDQVVPLFPDVKKVREDINICSGYDLLQHGMNHNVAASSPNTSTENRLILEETLSLECGI